MGRPSKYNWDKIRLDLETGQTHEYVHSKHGVPYDTLNKHLKRKPIEVNQQAKYAIGVLDEVSQVISQVGDKRPDIASNALEIAARRNEYILLFTDSAIRNQRVSNKALKAIEDKKSIDDKDLYSLDAHSRITQRNKETVLGKDKTTEISNTNAIQNNLTIEEISSHVSDLLPG